MMRLDVAHPMVPGWIIDFFMKNFASVFLTLMNGQAAKFDEGGPLRHLMSEAEHAPVYRELHRRLSGADGSTLQRASSSVASDLCAELDAELGRGGT